MIAIEATGATRLPELRYADFGAFGAERKQAAYGNLSSLLNYARFYLPELSLSPTPQRALLWRRTIRES